MELSVLILFFPLCFNSNNSLNKGSYNFDTSVLQPGDIIFREGLSFVSRMILVADENSPYSHTGLIYIEKDKVFVIHAVPAEESWETEVIKIEPIKDFLRKDRTAAVAVYRPLKQYEKYISVSVNTALKYAMNNTKFDSGFDLKDDSRLYCTELVWKAYLQAGLDLIDSQFDFLNVPLMKGYYILPGSLLKSRYLKNIISINFK